MKLNILQMRTMRKYVHCNVRCFSSKGLSDKNVLRKLESNNVPLEQKKPISPVQRVTYEYPPPPVKKPQPPKESSAWRRHIPLLFAVGGIVWAGYVAYYFLGEKSGEQSVLSPTSFAQYRITCRKQVSDDTILLEIAPKYTASKSMIESGATLWNAKKLWSIQIKHPMIQIARNYTPIPVYFMRSDSKNDDPLIRMMGTATDEGRMCLLIKKYKDGEMSNYLHSLPVGSDIEVRGPYVDHKFPYTAADSQKMRQPMLDIPNRMPPEKELDPKSDIIRAPNLALFTAGTGISTAFQLLLSPHNPPRGFVHVYHSARTRKDIPFQRFMLFLESAGRAKFHIFVDDEKKFISLKDIPSYHKYDPENKTKSGEVSTPNKNDVKPKKYNSVLQQYGDPDNANAYLDGVSYAVVCGPPGYIAYLAGNPGYNNDLPLGGLLAQKGWDLKNTARLSDL